VLVVTRGTPTALSLAGVPGAKLADLFPKTTYVDGVDQASFLVADDGLSARRSRPYTLNQYFASMRVDEFKYTFTAEIENGSFKKVTGVDLAAQSSPTPAVAYCSTSIPTHKKT
jgi:arylsulfatase A-like enzyme